MNAERPPAQIRSRDNPLLVQLRHLVRDGKSYRKLGRVWLEGDHLLRACLARGHALEQVVISDAAWANPELRALAQQGGRVAVLAEALFKDISGLASPVCIGGLVSWTADSHPVDDLRTVVLDRLQDPGNVGSILRSAAAMGVQQVLALNGTVGLWSAKVLRAGMGAHFGLHLCEGLQWSDVATVPCDWVATSSHAPRALHEQPLPARCGWVFGHEGQGVHEDILAACAATVRIPQPGGEESLNVAAAAAICLYEQARQRGV